MSGQARTSGPARVIAPPEVPGLPPDVRVRALDPAVDFPAVAAFMAEVNLADGYEQALTPEEVAIDWRRTPGFDPARDALIVEDAACIAALVNIDAQVRVGLVSNWIQGWVRRDRRREGIGRALLRWAEGHAAALLRGGENPRPDLPQVISFGVLDSNPAAVAFAAASCYPPVRYGFEMRRALDEPIPDLGLPAGVELRPVRDHWEPRVPDEGDFEGALALFGVDTSLWRVAWEGNEVVGSVMNAIFPEENARIGVRVGWLARVSVRRAWRGRGVAKALIASSLRALRGRGMQYAQLGVDAENPTGALALYEGLGFRPHVRWTTHRLPLDEVRHDEEHRP